MSSLPDYDAKKAAAALYGWFLCGWPSEATPTDMVLLARWEDKNGKIIDPPPVIVKADGRRFFDTSDGQHEVFCRLPYFDTPEVWLLLLRVEELRKLRRG